MHSVSPPYSMLSSVPFTATGMAIWVTAIPSTRESIPSARRTRHRAIGSNSRRTAVSSHSLGERSTCPADMPASREPTTSRDSGTVISPTKSSISPTRAGGRSRVSASTSPRTEATMQGVNSCFQRNRAAPASSSGPRL